MRLTLDALPKVFIKLREKGIAFGAGFDPRQIQTLGTLQGLGVELCTTNQHDLVCPLLPRPVVSTRNGRFQRRENLCAVQLQARLTTDHQIEPARQWATERVPSLATHDDRLAEGHGLEVLEICRQVPRHLVVEPDNVVFRQGSDHREGKGSLIHGRENSRGLLGQSALLVHRKKAITRIARIALSLTLPCWPSSAGSR